MIIIWLILSVVTGALAARKGYNFILWALAAGIIGLVILAFLPFANAPEKPPEEQARLRKSGNMIGGGLAVLGLFMIAMRVAAELGQ